MKIVKFKDFKAQWILEGTKTSTMRLFDDKDLAVGDILDLFNSDTKESFAKANVAEVLFRSLGEVDDVDLDGHEKWESKQHMLQTLQGYYGDRVDFNTPVKIVRFKLI